MSYHSSVIKKVLGCLLAFILVVKVLLGAESCDGGRCGIGVGGGGGFFEPASQCKLQAAGMVEHLQGEICLCRVSLTNPFISNLVLCQR